MRLILLISLFLQSIIVWGNISFKNYSVTEGLLHKTVYCITMDSDGFIWIGTSNGLSRFDGNSFYNFTHNSTNKHSLHGTSINAIEEGIDGKLWLSTEKGIEFFNKKTESFHPLTIPEIQGINFKKNIHIDNKGTIWLYNNNANILALNQTGDSITHRIDDITKYADKGIFQFQVSDTFLWIACTNGIIKYDTQNSQAKFIEKKPLLHCFSSQKINDSIITMSFLFDGIYVLNTKTESGYWIPKKYIEKFINLKTFIYDASFDSQGSLWVGTAPGFLIIGKNETTYFDHYSKNNYFDGGLVSCIYKDRYDNMWLGTYENGIYLKKNFAKYFTLSNKLYKKEINKTEITSFCLFDNGTLLYTDNRGIYRCNDYNNLGINSAEKIYNEATTNVFSINGTECLIKSTDTIYIYNSKRKKFTKITTAAAISFACKNSDDIVWIGTWIGLIVGYDLKTDTRYEFHIDSLQNSNIQIFAIEEDSDGSIWVGTVGEGLIHITNPTSKNRRFIQYHMKEKNDNRTPSNIVHCIYTDKYNNLWIGTNGDGIIKLNKQTKEIQTLTTKDGLVSNIIEFITSDNEGNIWFSSSIITKYNTQKHTFTHYTKHDGIGAGFINKGGAISKEGKLFFSNSQGFLSFNPKVLPKRKKVSMPILTHLYIKGNSVTVGDTIDGGVPYTQSITYSKKLTLPYTLNSFSIHFSSIQFQESDGIIYKYRLNKNQDWISTIPGNQIANYSEIKPGTYTFAVKARGGDGEWSKAKTIEIIITPPWWQTWWFKVLLSLIIISIISIIIISRIRTLKKYNEKLENTVTKRTKELTLSNEILEEKQLVIEMKNTQLNEALSSKNQLISILAHDFKNPLNGIVGIAKLLKNENETIKNSKVKKLISSLTASVNSLSTQMINVLDWVRSQNSKMTASPIDINLELLIYDVIDLENGNATQKNITISIESNYTHNAFVDPHMINTVFRNLLTNAIKFSQKGSSIFITIQEEETTISTSFIDTGIGITEKIAQHILFTNKTVQPKYDTNNEKGTGLGMQLCKNFIHKNNGTFNIENNTPHGTIISVSVPKGKTKANKHTIQQQNQKESFNDTHEYTIESLSLLIIEDNKETIDIIKETFNANFEIYEAYDGEEGAQIAKEIIPDIIISDINMPKKDGIELCAELKNDFTTSHIPILIITSYSDEFIKEQAFKNGANDFIEKPFNPIFFKKKVDALLEYKHKSIENAGINSESSLPDSHDDVLFTKIVDFIEDNVSNQNLSTDFLAEEIGISKSQIWRLFKKKTNKSIGNFIREKKLQKAAGMLMSGKYRIGEISDFIGFSDSRYFSRVFMKEYGISPSDYAKKFSKK
jgi:signal transduction histidine kinase/ligand-binding sensor domain-containing protein/DNA-binding response OmpR family regulator